MLPPITEVYYPKHCCADDDNHETNNTQHSSDGGGVDSDNNCRSSSDKELCEQINPRYSSDGVRVNSDDNYQSSINQELREQIERAKLNSETLILDYAPRAEKLGTFSTGCLLINRMIGTGIFETPKTVWMGTRSVSGALLMWCVGSVVAFVALCVYLELGLTVPRYLVRGQWRSVPRSGGEKNYVPRNALLSLLSRGY